MPKREYLSPTVAKRLKDVERMTLGEVQRLLFDCISELTTGKITAKESNALNRAAGKRMKAIKADLRGA
jgi:hypothetical protein